METFNNFIFGFTILLQPINLLYCFIGCLMGTLIGVLPGLGPPGALALLIPYVTHISPVSALIMLCGILYGAQYGGSTTAILVKIPGEPSSIMTCLDGYEMARQGRAGPALGMAAMGSFIAGTISIFGLIFFSAIFSEFALQFGPPEYFSLMVFAFIALIFTASEAMIKGMIMAVLGVTLGTIGLDPVTGANRFTFRLPFLMDGVGLIQAVIGLFGLSEILVTLETYVKQEIFDKKIKGLLPTLQDWKDSISPIFRASGIGFFLGLIPGLGIALPSFLSYGLEKRISKDPSRFGKGYIVGVAAPESANNAASEANLIPMLSLGIPTTASTAIVLGALMICGVQPGPLFIKESPQVFWGLVASLYLGNVMLLVLNLPLIGLWVKVLKIPYYLLSVLILLFCLIGSYGINYVSQDIIIMTIFGFIGYVAKKTNFDATPLVFGLILGPMLENSLRRSLQMSDGNLEIFFTRPISLLFIAISVILLLFIFWLKRTKTSAQDAEGPRS